jgi:hypothetical protein
MPPFEYKPFVNPYIGSISELMGKGDEAKAAALIRIGEIQARAAEQQGQAWGNAIQGLGDIGAEYLSPKAREARAIEKGQRILDANAKRRITEQGQRMTENTFQPSVPYKDFVPNSAVNPFDAPFKNVKFGMGFTPRAGVTADETVALAQAGPNGEIIENALPNEGLEKALGRVNLFGPADGRFIAPPKVAQPDALSRGMEGALGHMREGQTLPTGRAPQVETYEKASRNRYTTSQGLYDVRLAYDDLIEAGISTKVAMALAGQGQQANSIFAAYDKDKEELDKKQIAVRGSIANMAIQLMNTGMSAQDALTQASGPAGNRLSQDDMNAFAVQLNSQPTEQDKRALFLSEVEAWDAQGKKQVVNPGDYVINDNSGTSRQVGTRPIPDPSAASKTLAIARADYDEGIRNGSIPAGTKFTDWSRTTPAVPSLNEVQLALDVANGRPGAKEAWEIYQKANMSKAAAGATAPPGADFSAALPADSMSQDLLSQSGLSFNAFMVLTGHGGQLARDRATRNKANAEVDAWAKRSGRDVSTFQSQYIGYNKALELNVQRRNNTLTAESEVVATLENLDAAAKEAGLSDARMLNEFNLWLKGEGNSPDAATYAFHLNQLRNDLAQYNAASQGRTGSSMLPSDMRDAESVFKQGVSSGSLAGIGKAIKRSIERQGINLEGAVNRTRHDVWKLFGLGDKFVPSNVVITPDGERQTFPTDAQAEKFRQAIVTLTSEKG